MPYDPCGELVANWESAPAPVEVISVPLHNGARLAGSLVDYDTWLYLR